jgi:putative transposase
MDAGRNFNRHSIRLKEYDYSQPGFYFVTICVKNKKCILGDISENEGRFLGKEIKLSALGEIVKNVWLSMPGHHNVEIDEFIVMPSHIHGIIIIKSRGVARYAPTRDFIKQPAGSLATVVCSLKSESSKQIHRIVGLENFSWQRNYYEHIIGNEKALSKIRNYIINNPNHWGDDIENPQKISPTLDSDKYYCQVFNVN